MNPHSPEAELLIDTAKQSRLRKQKSSKTRVKALVIPLLMVAAGLVMIFAFAPARPDPHYVPYCGNERMQPGDTCHVTDYGHDYVAGHDESYSDLVHQHTAASPGWLIAGICFIGVAVLLVYPALWATTPKRRWGEGLDRLTCPDCGRKLLRKSFETYRATHGPGAISGWVTLCQPDCGFAWVSRDKSSIGPPRRPASNPRGGIVTEGSASGRRDGVTGQDPGPVRPDVLVDRITQRDAAFYRRDSSSSRPPERQG